MGPHHFGGDPIRRDLLIEGVVAIGLPATLDPRVGPSLWPHDRLTAAIGVHQEGDARAVIALHDLLSSHFSRVSLPFHCRDAVELKAWKQSMLYHSTIFISLQSTLGPSLSSRVAWPLGQ